MSEYKRDINLYSKNYLGLNITCLKELKKRNISKDFINDLKIIRENFQNSDTVSSVFLSFISIIISVFLFLTCCTIMSSQKLYFDRTDTNGRYCYFFLTVFQLGIVLGYLITIIQIFSKFKSSNNLDLIFNDSNCVDSFTFDMYTRFSPNLLIIKNISVICLIFSSIHFVIFILFLISGICYIKF